MTPATSKGPAEAEQIAAPAIRQLLLQEAVQGNLRQKR